MKYGINMQMYETEISKWCLKMDHLLIWLHMIVLHVSKALLSAVLSEYFHNHLQYIIISIAESKEKHNVCATKNHHAT